MQTASFNLWVSSCQTNSLDIAACFVPSPPSFTIWFLLSSALQRHMFGVHCICKVIGAANCPRQWLSSIIYIKMYLLEYITKYNYM
uniref:Uncharacterized protein n=1 Tax=Anguilla anguilla TaxID=7936 RepID=A0A0E9PCI3_ANGAN